MSSVELLDLERFGVSKERGFLPTVDPLENLPGMFSQFELAKDMSSLIELGKLGEKVEGIAHLDISNIGDDVADAIYRNASFIAAAYYFHVIGRGNSRALPEGLSRTLVEIADRFDKPPTLSHHSYANFNFRRKDPEGALVLENLEAIITFTGDSRESDFIVSHVGVEALLGPAIAAAGLAQQAVLRGDEEQLGKHLETIDSCLARTGYELAKVYGSTDKDFFSEQIRPLLYGFENLVYEGQFGNKPQTFRGESAAQAPFVQFFDAVLGVPSADPEFSAEMRRYMPNQHREFIFAAAKGPSIRGYVEERNGLIPLYNSCVEKILRFKKRHKTMVDVYLKKNDRVNATGGSGEDYLGNTVRNTERTKIQPV